MAVTVSGTIGGQSITFPTNSALQQQLATSILAGALGSTGSILSSGGASTATAFTVSTGTSNIITGSSAVPLTQVALDGQTAIYATGGSLLSIVVAADNSNSSVVNNTPGGALIASTGAGGNVLLGLSGANQFVTGTGGQDIVFLNGAGNTLTSNGSDAVLVGGPSTIVAAAGGADNVLMTTGTTLAFINGSVGKVDTITGASNGVIVVAGSGATSIASGAGPEAFFVDTAAGNVTLNGNLQTNDAFTFVKDAATTPGAANVVVTNFATGDTIGVHGYAGAQFTVAAAGSGSVLALTDGSTVTFTNVSAATLSATVKPV